MLKISDGDTLLHKIYSFPSHYFLNVSLFVTKLNQCFTNTKERGVNVNNYIPWQHSIMIQLGSDIFVYKLGAVSSLLCFSAVHV